ncbi:MAG: TIGR04283 family arsenosugar biosynthesis glycosyltransferase [Gammaproteobacteria bacterium]|jgi:rSAM/selenodomain-associated transferase 2
MISIIIPVLNEERALPATLQRVFAQQAVAASYEVIVVDGGSTDATADIVAREPGIAWQVAETGRARQMNAGAHKASGDWLLFLHADTLLPDDALQTISVLPADVQGGGFTHRFSGSTRGLRLVSWLHNFRCRRTHVFYGDQAMFVRRQLFFELGLFPDEPILEDLLFGEKLASATRPVMLDSTVITDSRKFEQKGVWLSLMRVLLILISHELRLPIPARRFFANIR